ncbi:MAG: hypothetical protein JNN24_03240 [Hyphomicrobium zavarzinii]|jgi:hypothetical protein|uniref:hypothetical protein n=1 Tax=Hyphomicrobium zavarzinii TaxID=48292 RepID=UPI001A55D397|nr:hypothetical protein [Hyphomicrobium zavarzinii]MBL8844764.1 hypothetical protein [Hyphomicrobium zavarzinii]
MTDTVPESSTKIDSETINGISRSVRRSLEAAGYVVGDLGAELFAPVAPPLDLYPRYSDGELRRRDALDLAMRLDTMRGIEALLTDAERIAAYICGSATSELTSGVRPSSGDRESSAPASRSSAVADGVLLPGA